MYDVLVKMQDTKEKGYLVEKKTLLKFKTIFKMQNGDDFEQMYYKLSYIISRRLFFVYNGNMECEQNNEVELSLLLQQIVTDIMCYINVLQIKHKVSLDFDENYWKSFILRSVKTLSNKSEKIQFKLRKIRGKTVYFIKSQYYSEMFVHFYTRVLLSKPIVISWKKIGLNGGYHYLNKRRIIEPNVYNNFSNFTDEIIDFVEKQNDLEFYIDSKMIDKQEEYVVNQIKNDSEINKKWGDYFMTINDLSSKEINEILNLEIYKKKMKKIQYIKELDNVNELLKNNLIESKKKKLENKKKYLVKLVEKNILITNSTMHNKWVQKDFSYAFTLKIYLEYIDFFKNYKDPLFFTLYFDFRGRNYYNSMVSPSQGWPFRFLYYFKDENFSKSDNLIDTNLYKNEIESIEKKIGKLDICKKRSLVWVLLSIGAITIEKKEKIKEEEFIKEGYNNYINGVKINDMLENSELMYYYLIIDNYNNDMKNRYLLKDISGSIFQNASIILGIKNEASLELLNINNKEWHDPYAPLIKEINSSVKEELKIFFTRKTLKKSIMTRYYNAKLLSSFNYFIKEVKNLKEYNDNLFKDLWKEFEKVFKQLKNLEKKLIYDNSNEDYNKFLESNKIDTVGFDGINFSIIAYSLKPYRIDIIVNKIRITVTTYKISKKMYVQKTKNSMMPNIFHGEDSLRARVILNKFNSSCFSIHDAFGVSHRRSNELINVANETFDINIKRKFYMNRNKINKKLFSKFIIL